MQVRNQTVSAPLPSPLRGETDYWVTGQRRFEDLGAVQHALQDQTLALGAGDSLQLSHLRPPTADELARAASLGSQAQKLDEASQANRGTAGLALKGGLVSSAAAGLAAVGRCWPLAGAMGLLGAVGLLTAASERGTAACKQASAENLRGQAQGLEQPQRLGQATLSALPGTPPAYLLRGEKLQILGEAAAPQQAALQAFQLGQEFDHNWSKGSCAVFATAAAVAGTPEKARVAAQLGAEFDHNWSRKSQATFTLAAAHAATPEAARQALKLGREFDHNWSKESQAVFTEAAALAGSEDKARQALTLGREFDHNWSKESQALFTLAAAVAGDEGKARQALKLGREFDHNWSKKSQALFTVAAAVAGDEAKARQALALGREFDHNWSRESQAMFTLAAAVAGDDSTARSAYALGSVMDHNWSKETEARFTLAAAAALRPDRAHLAVSVPTKGVREIPIIMAPVAPYRA